MVSSTPLKKGSSSSLNPALSSWRMVTLAGSRFEISVLRSSFMCLNMLQSLKERLLMRYMCSFCLFWKTLLSIPRDFNKTMVCLFKKPALYLFQSKMSRYLPADSWVQLYLIMLFLRWIELLSRFGFFTKIPFAPLYLIWSTDRSLIDSFREIF